MRIKADELIQKTAILLGETTMCSREECGPATLSDRIALEIEACAAEVILAAGKEALSGWKSFSGNGITELEDGSVALPLPDDFLTLVWLRLSGWRRPVAAAHSRASLAARLQESRWAGVRASPGRPAAVIGGAGGNPALLLYGSHDRPPQIAEGGYIAAPRIDADGYIDLPRLLEIDVARRLADRVSKGC